jgi:hypothetical protein
VAQRARIRLRYGRTEAATRRRCGAGARRGPERHAARRGSATLGTAVSIGQH